MLNDGVVDITPEEEKAIDGFVKDLEQFYKKQTYERGVDVLSSFNRHTSEIAPKYGLDRVRWSFYTNYDDVEAYYDPEYSEISINVGNMVPDSKEEISNQEVDFAKMRESIYHEWVHFKQDEKLKKTHTKGLSTFEKMYQKTAYHDIKWEQMAIAREEIEWIKNHTKEIDSEWITRWLQRWGLSDAKESDQLKETNPKAYKRIMKYAIMFLLKKKAQAALKVK